MGRTLLLRVLGFLTTLAVGIAAVELIAYGVDRPIGWLDGAMSDFSSWASRTPEEGAAVLAGLGLVVLAMLCIPVVIRWTGRRLLLIEATPAGATQLDLDSLARTLETTVTNAVDSHIEVRHRRGRIVIVTPSSPNDTYKIADETSEAVDTRLGSLGLTEVAYTIATGKRQAGRAR
ncbi:MAG: hypothetical protein ACXW1Y_05580 [Acidimicrobiia bacterium]